MREYSGTNSSPFVLMKLLQTQCLNMPPNTSIQTFTLRIKNTFPE